MTGTSADHDARMHRLTDVLLDCLRAADAPAWPGADGLTVRDALRSYRSALAAGKVPGRATLAADHPDLADCLDAFFAADEVK